MTRRSEDVKVGDFCAMLAPDLLTRGRSQDCRLVVNEVAVRPLRGDPELLRRAIQNVVRNAIRYAPPGTDVELRTDDGPSGLVITVRDAGAGMPRERRRDSFSPLSRRGRP